MSAYKKVIQYHFTVDGEEIAITEITDSYIRVEETRKNGQEDTHMSGELAISVREDKWVWDWVEGEHSFVEYGSQELADGIREYLNANELPFDESDH